MMGFSYLEGGGGEGEGFSYLEGEGGRGGCRASVTRASPFNPVESQLTTREYWKTSKHDKKDQTQATSLFHVLQFCLQYEVCPG